MKKLVVLASGSGTNLQRIIDEIKAGAIRDAQISLVITDRDCYATERAKQANIPTLQFPRKGFSIALDENIPADTDLIVLAGFLSILSSDFCKKWEGKIVNIHPALLPKFGGKGMWGMNVHNAVVETKAKESGATVHFVTSGIDEGEIILQGRIEVDATDTPELVAEKVHQVEYDIFPKAIDLVLNGPK